MNFLGSFVEKKSEQSSGGWDFSQDNRGTPEFILGGLSLSHEERVDDLITSDETPKTAAVATLT